MGPWEKAGSGPRGRLRLPFRAALGRPVARRSGEFSISVGIRRHGFAGRGGSQCSVDGIDPPLETPLCGAVRLLAGCEDRAVLAWDLDRFGGVEGARWP